MHHINLRPLYKKFFKIRCTTIFNQIFTFNLFFYIIKTILSNKLALVRYLSKNYFSNYLCQNVLFILSIEFFKLCEVK